MQAAFSVLNGRRLMLNGTPVEFKASPNFNTGYRIKPQGILLHDTAGHDHGNGTIAHFMKPAAQASAHIIITDEDEPRVIQMVEFDRRAWHAGRSEWRGLKDCNSRFIGIELSNPGRLWGTADGAYPEGFRTKFTAAEDGIQQIDSTLHGRSGAWWKPYSAKQIALLEALVVCLAREFPEIKEVVGHCQVSPGRKVDPTPIMYRDHMARLIRSIAKVEVAAGRYLEAEPLTPSTVFSLQQRLNALGYGPLVEDGVFGSKTGGAIWSFQMENALKLTGRPDGVTVSAIHAADARPAPIAGRQAAKKQDLARSDPDAAAGNTQAWMGQVQLVLAAVSAILAMIADLGKHITHLVATYGGSTIIVVAVTLLTLFGIRNWTAGRSLVARAYRNWISGTSNITTPPPKQSAQEG